MLHKMSLLARIEPSWTSLIISWLFLKNGIEVVIDKSPLEPVKIKLSVVSSSLILTNIGFVCLIGIQ